jgi:hypothetical protein
MGMQIQPRIATANVAHRHPLDLVLRFLKLPAFSALGIGEAGKFAHRGIIGSKIQCQS